MTKEYGHYDDAAREYVITDPCTPWPWINYLGTEDFFGLISNTAGGYSFCKDAKFRRITRYRYNGVPMDAGGRQAMVKHFISSIHLPFFLQSDSLQKIIVKLASFFRRKRVTQLCHLRFLR